MAHEISTTADGRSAMAWVGQAPWHGLGQELQPGAPIETWATAAGMDFYIGSSPVCFRPNPEAAAVSEYAGKKVLFRNDTGAALSVVSNRYKVVQPIEVLEFFRDMTESKGWELETAGVLFAGQKYWALAKTGIEARIKGQDLMKDYVLLATACDGTLRTMAKRTSVRVVCNNTLSYAANNGEPEVRVSHATEFSPDLVKSELGLIEANTGWETFIEQTRMLAERAVTNQEAVAYVTKLFGDPAIPVEQQPSIATIGKVLQLYDGGGRGADLASTKGTAFGLLNAVTEYIDWHKGKNPDRRMESAWFYAGNTLKQAAFNEAVLLAA